jgi:hypothetical protein
VESLVWWGQIKRQAKSAAIAPFSEPMNFPAEHGLEDEIESVSVTAFHLQSVHEYCAVASWDLSNIVGKV